MDRRAIAIASGAFLSFCISAFVMAASTDALLGSAAGAFLSLAVDLNHGILYRPLIDDTGIGGTRYFPLVFVLNAALIRLGFSPVMGGRLIALASSIALIWASVRILEALDVPRPWARALAPLALCSSPGVFALLTIRGDVLPAALDLWGVVFSIRALKRDRGSDVGAAVAFFAFAIFAKASAAYAAAAMTVALFLNGRPRKAIALSVGTLMTAAILLALANLASEGRMLETMRACLFGGGLSNLVRAPMSTVYVLIRQDPLCSLLLILFFVSLMNLPPEGWKEPLTWLASGALAMTVFLFASPGVDINHVLDFYAVTMLFVGYQIVQGRLYPALASRAIAVGVVFTLFAAYLDLRHSMLDGEISQRPAVRALVQRVRAEGKPIFSSDGFIPASQNERSYMLDPWMFQMLRARDPRYDAALQSKIADRYFGAVVLLNTDLAGLAALYGDRFLSLLRSNYELAGDLPPYVVYRVNREAD